MKRVWLCRVVWGLTVLASIQPGHCLAESTAPVSIVLGQSVIRLNSQWKFHIGDQTDWADPNFDDSSWETVNLTPAPGAHDDDVGLTGYVPGWEARGHRGYSGYAWYRLHAVVSAPTGASLSLAGPPAVDSAYQVFVNGTLLGGAGRFGHQTPTVFSIQPHLFLIPAKLLDQGQPRSLVIAFRVWMGPWDLADPAGGGIHISPALGESNSIQMMYQMQWLETVRGYVVEIVEAALFLLLAVMAVSLNAFEPVSRRYWWLAAALVLTALYRTNQAVFFWWQFETVHDFELVSIVLLIPLCLACWTLAWRSWFRLRGATWTVGAVVVLTLFYMAAQFLARSWFYGIVPHSIVTTCHYLVNLIRILFVLLTGVIVYRGIRQQGREGWIALPAIVLVSIGQFAQELSALGIQGIWFPFGTGVSRTQFAYAAFDVALFILLLHQLRGYASPVRTNVTNSSHKRLSSL
ncbi:MAG: hypothetical protein WA324_26755 [Bryobacteraceae bacterium]